MSAKEPITVVSRYTGYAVYRGDKLVHQSGSNENGWPVPVLQALGYEVEVLGYSEDQAFWSRRAYQPPQSLAELTGAWAAKEISDKRCQLRSARETVARLEAELGERAG